MQAVGHTVDHLQKVDGQLFINKQKEVRTYAVDVFVCYTNA